MTLNKRLAVTATVDFSALAEEVQEWDSVDDIVEFVVACIPDQEVAEAVILRLRAVFDEQGQHP